MGYYIRILSPSDLCVAFSELQASLVQLEPRASLAIESGTDTEWDQLILSHQDGTAIALLERNPVNEGSLGAEELIEFKEEIADCAPASAVAWLLEYFPRVRTIFAFQVLSGTESEGGWDILGALKEAIWQRSGGILQADAEGFSNEDGYHIIWQFADNVSGPWWMGVLRDKRWVHFEMDLGNSRHREAFFKGQVPSGVKLP
jgi:hypothetical protein